MMDYKAQIINARHSIPFSNAEKSFLSMNNRLMYATLRKHLIFRRFETGSCKVSRNVVGLSSNANISSHAFAVQAFTTDGGSEGNKYQGPSSVDWACLIKDDKSTRSSLLDHLHGCYSIVKRKSLLLINEEACNKAKMEFLKLDIRQAVKHVNSNKLSSDVIRWWEHSQPWIKWPCTIFIPWFFSVSIVYGLRVSMDLAPLWVLGPVAASFVIKTSIQLFLMWRQLIANPELGSRVLTIYREAKTSGLARHVLESASSNSKKLKRLTEEKLDVVSRVQNGQFNDLMKHYLEKRFLELWEFSIDKYEDMRLFYLIMDRRVKNVF